jgi:TRAP-type uncharacterized transport system fused permease subunit
MHILFSVVLLFTIYAVSQKERMRIIALMLLLPALFGTWIGYFADHAVLHVTAMGSSILFLGFTLTLIVSDVFKEEDVTIDTISGAICVYLLIGLTWSELYSAIEFFQPNSFTVHQYLPQKEGYCGSNPRPDLCGRNDCPAGRTTHRPLQ